MNINFLLILKKRNNIIINNELYSEKLFIDIIKYILDRRYIKFEEKPVLGISNFTIDFNNISIIRKIFREKGLGEIFILSNYGNKNLNETLNENIFDGIYYSPQYDSLEPVIIGSNKTFNYFYTRLLYYNFSEINFKDNKKIFRTSIPMSNYPCSLNNSKISIYRDYSPEKYYFLNKLIIDWTKKNHDKDNQYIFIDDFQNLEQNDLFGFANLNYFSKSLYGLPLITNKYNLKNLQKKNLVLVQAHIYYIDLLDDIINKTNNIPIPFDLFITTNTEKKKKTIENYLQNKTKANKFEILITQNKGRDVGPFLGQLKDIITQYRYFCHIHTKKHGVNEKLGKYWQFYLYENLLGNKSIISKILSDFENNNKLGFIFPENFYAEVKDSFNLNNLNLKYMNHILRILFPKNKLKVGKFLFFPVGNMFWARTGAVYQIFNKKLFKLIPEEKGQFDKTIMHAIERIWLYLTKLNGYYYKTCLYYI